MANGIDLRARSARAMCEPLEGRRMLALPQAYDDVDFGISDMVADPSRNLVYVADYTHFKVVAVDTQLARTVSHRTTNGAPNGLAVSVTGDRLFVSVSNRIDVYGLPNLNLVKTLSVGVATYSLVHGANDRLYAETAGPARYYTQSSGPVKVINASTGAVLGDVPRRTVYRPLLRTNRAGTKLYTREPEHAVTDEYDITGSGLPVRSTRIPRKARNWPSTTRRDGFTPPPPGASPS